MASLIRSIRFNVEATAPDFMFWLCWWGWLYPPNPISVSPLLYLEYWWDLSGSVIEPLTSMMVICSFGAFQIKVTRSLKLTAVLTLSGLMGTAPSNFRAVIHSGIMQLKLGIKGCLLYSSWYSTGIPRNWYWNSKETLL